MKNYEKIIVNELLNLYENRLQRLEVNGHLKQKVYLRFTIKTFPEYFDTRLTAYDDIHQIVNNLEHKGIISCYWKDNQKDHILEKVALNIGRLQTAYTLVGRIPAKGKEVAYHKMMSSITYKNQTIKALHQWISQRLVEKQSVKRYVDLDNLQEFEQVLKGVAGIIDNENECFVREMSMLLYGDSKQLEELRSKVESIIRDFYTKEGFGQGEVIERSKEISEFSEDKDIFEEFNVLKNPSLVLLKGSGHIEMGGGTIELSQLKQGLGICSEDLQNVVFQKDSKVQKLITVENLTAFYRFYEENSLIIYLGGFHNKARRELIQRAVLAYEEAKLFHWGDIDVGGFRIYLDLCRKTMLPFHTLYMDIETLIQYEAYAKPLTKNDEKALSALNQLVEESLCNVSHLNPMKSELTQILATLNHMQEKKVKLEQEIVAYLVKNSE